MSGFIQFMTSKNPRCLDDYWTRQNKINPNYNVVSNYAFSIKEFDSWSPFSGNYDHIYDYQC